jgi:RND family efflux transporter MFP subunit
MSLTLQKVFIAVSTTVFLSFTLIACKEDVPQPVERIRTIKAMIVTDRAFGLSRKFPGIVEAADRSSLSFEVSGNVKELRVDVGDKVTNGQIIAVLDSRPFQLKVQAAEAELGRAKAGLTNKKKHLDRLQGIAKLDPGAVSGRSLDQAEAAYESAQNTVSYSASQLNLAKRDLQKTKLLAPFDGVIAKRHVDPFKEVARGQPIYDIFYWTPGRNPIPEESRPYLPRYRV